jgi:hypothetical protein
VMMFAIGIMSDVEQVAAVGEGVAMVTRPE